MKVTGEAVFRLVHQSWGLPAVESQEVQSLEEMVTERRGEISSGQTFSLSFLLKFFNKERQKSRGGSRPWLNSLEKVLSSTIGTYIWLINQLTVQIIKKK